MADIATIAEIGTAAGTLFLGVATVGATRTANRAARVAERSLRVGTRPALAATRPQDEAETVTFGDGHSASVRGGCAHVERDGDTVFLAIPLRNVGPGLAVLHGYDVRPDLGGQQIHGIHDRDTRSHRPVSEFRTQQRDIYVASGATDCWQAALWDPADPLRTEVLGVLAEREAAFAVDLLYGDHEGGQRLVSRFALIHRGGAWQAGVVFHWFLDGADPRD
jgi:hypothetical protein